MIKLAIDLGSSMTKIYRADTNSGIVLAEPSCVAVSADGEVKAIGKAAKKLIGKTAEHTDILYPVYESEIVDMHLATRMMKEFLSRIGLKATWLTRVQALIGVPCGIDIRQLDDYRALADECGLRGTKFVEQPYLAALGAGAKFGDPVFCLDVGGGVTNAAVVSGDGIIAGMSMNIGGNNMDANIMFALETEKNLLIGALTAERLKNEIGSLLNGARGVRVAEGCAVDSRHPAAASVSATELRESIRVYVDKVAEYAASVLWNLPAEVAAAVNRNGVYLSGGVMKIPGVAKYIGERLGDMPYRVCEEPQFTTALGGGVLLRDKELLNKFSLRED